MYKNTSLRLKMPIQWGVAWLFILVAAGVILLDSANATDLGERYLNKEVKEMPVKERLARMEKRIPLHYNRRVHSFIEYFIEKNRSYSRELLRLRQRYFPVFEYYLNKYEMPEELKYLAVVESGLRPRAVSPVGAAGLWQFMPSTGEIYGLKQGRYIDQRLDPHLATEAACRYLKSLYNRFGQWELALAAFNSGPGWVSRAIRRSGGKRSFWKLYRYLPRETRSYVPQFVAVAYTMNYHAYHGLFTNNYEYMPRTDTVWIKEGLDLRHLSLNLGLCKDELADLNPAYLWGVLPNDGKSHVLRLPVQVIPGFESRRDTLLETLASLSGPVLAEVETKLKKGEIGKRRIKYRVRRGDAISLIARRYGVKVRDIRRWNRLSSNRIYAGQRLKLWVSAKKRKADRSPTRRPKNPSVAGNTKVPPSQRRRTYYVVQPGDTLWGIARSKDLNLRALKRLNSLYSSRIYEGQRLLLPL